MNNSPYLGYHWLNYERGVLSAYQYCLVKSGKKHTQDWEQIEFESLLEDKFPDLLRSYRRNQKRMVFRQRLVGIFSSFKTFLRV